MTFSKSKTEGESERMESIKNSKIECVEQISSESDQFVQSQDCDRVGVKPKISLKFRSAKFVHLWDIDSTNTYCLCGKHLTHPTDYDLRNKITSSQNTVSRCGCAFHTYCIDQHLKNIDQKQINCSPRSSYPSCPLCKKLYVPITVANEEIGVFVAASKATTV